MDIKFVFFPLCAGFLSLLFALYKYIWVRRQDPGSQRIREIGKAIADGAMAFMKREYRVLLIIGLSVAVLLVLGEEGYGRLVAVSFVVGALFSALAGLFGMKAATAANMRTTNGAMQDLSRALMIAFSGGSVMGLVRGRFRHSWPFRTFSSLHTFSRRRYYLAAGNRITHTKRVFVRR